MNRLAGSNPAPSAIHHLTNCKESNLIRSSGYRSFRDTRMVRHMPYVQQWKGSYRFRRRVPDHLKPIIGKPEWVAALGTKDKAEANRLVVPHIGRTDQIISDAERGDYPPLPHDRIEPIACDWWR